MEIEQANENDLTISKIASDPYFDKYNSPVYEHI